MATKTVVDVLKKSGFKKITSKTTVATVLSQLNSTHDAIFVFDGDQFKGIANLYHSFAKRSISGEEKIGRCLYHPPAVSPKDSLVKVAGLMVQSRVYQLPVIQKGNFVGVVFAEDVLKWARSLPLFKNMLIGELKIRKYVSIDENKTVDQAIHLMIANGSHRILVSTKEDKMVGILTLYDLRSFFTRAKDRISFLSRTPIKRELARKPVGKVSRRLLVTILIQETFAKAVNLMLSNQIGSLVVYTDRGSLKPLGLLTFRDLLKIIANKDKQTKTASFKGDFNKKKIKVVKQMVERKINRLLLNNPLFMKKVKSVNLDLKQLTKDKAGIRLPLLEATALVRLDESNKELRIKTKGRKATLMIDDMIKKMKTLLRKRKK